MTSKMRIQTTVLVVSSLLVIGLASKAFSQAMTCPGKTCQDSRCTHPGQDCIGKAAGATCYYCDGGSLKLCITAAGTCAGDATAAEKTCGIRWRGKCAGGKCMNAEPDVSIIRRRLPGGGGVVIIVDVKGCNLIGC